MKSGCDECGGHLEFDIAELGKRVSCPHCGLETELCSGVQIPTPTVQKGPTPAYYILEGQQTNGPLTLQQLRAMWISRKVHMRTMHCEAGDDQWRALGMLQHLLEPGPPARPTPEFIQGSFGPRVVVVAKSRGIYIVLGLFFGSLGVHNFYAGRNWSGAIQLLITLFLGWAILGFVITIPWSLLEILTVTQDANGTRMY